MPEFADRDPAGNDILRVMFYNIYGYKWYPDKENQPHLNSGPVPLRQKMESELIGNYVPDVLGMQEYCAAFHKGMTPLLEQIGYSRVEQWYSEPDSKGNPINFTPLFYRSEKLELLQSGYQLYDGANDVSSKSLTWAVFEKKSCRKRFIAICTHFMYNDPKLTPEEQNQTRVWDADQLLSAVERIQAIEGGRFSGLPVIVGGDLNCRWGSDPFTALRSGGFEWLYDLAKVKNDSAGIKPYATYDEQAEDFITCPVPVDDPHRAIDHMFLRQERDGLGDVLSYSAITDREAFLCSDHCPRVAEFLLK